MRLLVVLALVAVLVLADSAALDKKNLSNRIKGELAKLLKAEKAEKEALKQGGQDKRQDEEDDGGDDEGLPDMNVIFEDGRDRVFLGVLLTPEEAVGLVEAAEQTGGWISEDINIYTLQAFFFEDRDDWIMGSYLTSELAVGLVAGLHGEWPPTCVWATSGCDISGFAKSLADRDDIAVSGYGMDMPDAIPLVGAHIDPDTGAIDEPAVHTDAAAAGSFHQGRLVGFEEAVAGVAEALGVDSPMEEKKSLTASKKSAEIADLLQKLREYVRDLNQK
ncbi:Hypp4206 [Branchiostoma lanceolatum]|uniref:Hypp4206 protein n=1 Tax=Branchiostoma lanceolatum TaxID=7740 RepID=A0A8K0A5S4_BRALA|nr:Hypp4206 [Branchiostoma lanceolatum]